MKLMVLDGNSVINRAYYGVRALTTRDGFFTNAIYGFLNILEKLRADEKPDALCVAFDLKAPTFRHLKYDGYKATRHPMPDELAMQMPVMKDVLRAMRIPIFECEGWEADDVIGTIGKRCGHAGWDCVIVTGDRDSLQLIDEHVTVKLVSSKLSQTVAVNYDPAKFREEYGFEPIHLIDLKALMGDSSDNIPGVAGVGPKTATQLLLDYGTLDGVYAHLDAVKEKLRAKLEQGRDSAYLSYDLATIRCEAPIEFSPEACLVQPYDEAALYELFARLEFTRLIARYGLHAPQETAENGMIDGVCTSEVVSDAARAEELAASFQKEHYVNLIAEPDLSAIAVNTDESGYYFCGDALESTKFMSTLFGVSVKKVTHDCKPLMRRHAKAVNFGIVYGISEFSLSEDIGVTRKEARQYIDNYLAHYAGVRTYMHEIVEQAKRDGYVTTLFGRRRELPELKSSNFNIRSFGERVALNTPIQGTAADIIKLARIRVDAALRRQKLKARLVLQVHDELIVECPVKEAEQVKKIVTAEMENVVQLKVPLLAEAKSGASWYEAK